MTRIRVAVSPINFLSRVISSSRSPDLARALVCPFRTLGLRKLVDKKQVTRLEDVGKEETHIMWIR